MGVPAGAIDLIPPIGTGAGLPFTIVCGLTTLTDAGGAGTENYALFDTNLWANRMTTNRPKSPLAWGGANTSFVRQTKLDPSHIYFLGLTMHNTPPALNFATGSLENGQAIQDIGRGTSRFLAFEVLLSRFKDDCERRGSSPISQANRLHKPSCRQPHMANTQGSG